MFRLKEIKCLSFAILSNFTLLSANLHVIILEKEMFPHCFSEKEGII